jgi:hypothetical protein
VDYDGRLHIDIDGTRPVLASRLVSEIAQMDILARIRHASSVPDLRWSLRRDISAVGA